MPFWVLKVWCFCLVVSVAPDVATKHAELGTTVSFGAPNLFMGSSITHHDLPMEVEPAIASGMGKQMACLWLHPWVVEDAGENGGHQLAYACMELLDMATSGNGQSEPEVRVVELWLELIKSGIDGPSLSLSSPQHIAWNHLIGVQNQSPWLVN